MNTQTIYQGVTDSRMVQEYHSPNKFYGTEKIWGKGKEDQIVVLFGVRFEKGDPLSKLSQPCRFSIMDPHINGVYRLKHLLTGEEYPCHGEWLVDQKDYDQWEIEAQRRANQRNGVKS